MTLPIDNSLINSIKTIKQFTNQECIQYLKENKTKMVHFAFMPFPVQVWFMAFTEMQDTLSIISIQDFLYHMHTCCIDPRKVYSLPEFFFEERTYQVL
mgnify:CR=1 FL=1